MMVSEWFLGLPDTVQAAVFGASIAIAGVVLNNVVTYFNTGRQLRHDREQKALERSVSLRRDACLGAAEFLFEGLYVVLAIGDLEEDHRKLLANWRRASMNIAKLHVLANPDLIDAITQAGEALTRATMMMTVQRSVALHEPDAKRKQLLQIELLDTGMKLMADVQPKLIPVAGAMRRELGINIDEARYAAVVFAARDRLLAYRAELLQELRRATT